METILTTQREDTLSCTACVSGSCALQRTCYCIAENFQGRKLLQIGKKCNSRRKLLRIARFYCDKGCHTSNFAEKTCAYSHKAAKFAKVFTLKSFPLYGFMTRNLEIKVCNSHCHCWYIFHYTTAPTIFHYTTTLTICQYTTALTICPFLIALATSSALILIPGRGRVGGSVCMVLGTMALRAFSGAGV